MALNVTEWIDEQFKDVEISDEDKKILVEKFGDEKVADRIEAGTLRRGDYSRKMDELATEGKTAKQEAEEVRLKAETKYGELAKWEKSKDAEAKQLQAQLKQSEQRSAAAEAALKKAADEAGLDLKDLGITLSDGKPPVDNPPVDTDKFVTKEQLKRLNGQMVEVFTAYAPELIALSGQHHAERGEVLDTVALVEEARKSAHVNKSLKQVYEELHGVADFRAKKTEAEVQKRITEAKQEGIDEGIRQATAPPDSRSGGEIYSPALRVVAKEQKARGTPDMTPVERAVQRTLANRAKKAAAA